MSISIDFWKDFGSLLGPTLRYFCDLSVIWDAKVGDSFQVHVFDDPEMEMLADRGGSMC